MGIIRYKDIAYGGGSSVTEGYYKVADGKFYEHFDGTTYSDEITGEDEILYLDLSTNNLYRWSTGASLFVLVGKSTLASLNDTNISSPTDGQALEYNGTSSKWVNVAKKAADTPTFTEASTRANLAGSGETMATILGKIKKWFTDLAAHATVPLDDETVKIGTYDDDSAVFSTCTKATYNDGVLTLASKVNFNETIAQNVFIPEVDIAEKSDTDPYIYRPSVANGDRVSEDIVGASVGWNQLAPTLNNWSTNEGTKTYDSSTGIATITPTNYSGNSTGIYKGYALVTGHKHLLVADVNPTNNVRILFGSSSGDGRKLIDTTGGKWNTISCIVQATFTTCVLYGQVSVGGWSSGTIQVKNVMSIDLTIALGATIADHIYSLEQATAGAGVAFFRKYFPNSYYPYNAGELLSVEVEGKKYNSKNLLDPLGNENTRVKTTNGITFIVNADGSITCNGTATAQARFYFKSDLVFPFDTIYSCGNSDSAKAYCYAGSVISSGKTITAGTSVGTNFIAVNNGVTVSNYTVKPMIRRADVTDATYEPYHLTTYTFPSQTLRGLFTLVDGELKASGDVYREDGVIKRNFGIVNLGGCNWTKATTQGGVVHFYTTSIQNNKADPNSKRICKYVLVGTTALLFSTNNSCYQNANGAFMIHDDSLASGDETAFKNAMNGVYLVYELAAPTTEQVEPLVMPQICDKNGTEEFITDGIVPVGHESTYYNYPDYMEEGEYKDFRDRVDYAPELAKWHKVGIYANGDTITIDGYYNEIMLVPNHYSGTTLLACASPAIFPFSLFKSITLQNSTESERIDITPAGVVGVTGTYFSNVTIFVR